MRTVKLGKFTLPDYAAEKPVMIRSNGQLIYASDLLKKTQPPRFGAALASPENKAKLAIERLKIEPDFVFGVIGGNGKYTKAEVLLLRRQCRMPERTHTHRIPAREIRS
jgi:hypothetical protein